MEILIIIALIIGLINLLLYCRIIFRKDVIFKGDVRIKGELKVEKEVESYSEQND